MKTVTDVNTVNQLLTYSKQAEAGIHQKAIQMLLGAIINCMTGKLGKQTLFSFCSYQQITNDETNKTVTCAGEKV